MTRLLPLIWALGAVLLTVMMIIFPQETAKAARQGLESWWLIVFPSLLPFFILAEIMKGLGIVRFLGVLLEPVMRPLFNLPGSAAFVVAVGFTSGFPIGAALTAQLRSEGLVTRLEGQRLLAFTHNASPLFMLGAVAVGMFDNPALGVSLALSHYLSNLVLGFSLRYFGRKDPERSSWARQRGPLLRRAAQELIRAQREDNRPIGQLIGDAVRHGMTSVLSIGGFIILFAVIIKVLQVLGGLQWLGALITAVGRPLGMDPVLAPALASGLLEVTLGTLASSQAPVPFHQQVMATSAVLAWSGLAVHAQVASFISRTDLRLLPFIIARFIHSLLAMAITLLLVVPPSPAWTSSPSLPLHTYLTLPWDPLRGILTAFSILFCLIIIALTFRALAYGWWWLIRR